MFENDDAQKQTLEGNFMQICKKSRRIVVQTSAWNNIVSLSPLHIFIFLPSFLSPLKNVHETLTQFSTTSCASFSLIYVNICWCFLEQVEQFLLLQNEN